MNRPLAVVHGGATVYRVARRPDAWRWPDWAHAGPDGTFGNRWDDPEGTYRVLYACSQRVGAFVETLARFRPSAGLIAGLAVVEGEDHTLPPGTIPPTWLDDRCVGVARVDGDFVDAGNAATLAALNEALAARLAHHGIRELDAAAIRVQAPRKLTQEVSRFIYQQTLPDGRPAYAGIFYRSRLGDDLNNWAIFERNQVDFVADPDTDIRPNDPDFLAAVRLLGLRLKA